MIKLELGDNSLISAPNILPHEKPREYRQLLSGFLASHQPRNDFERSVIETLAEAAWELRRVRAVDADFWENVGGSYNRGTAGIAEALAQAPEKNFRAHFKLRFLVQRQYEKAMNDLYRMLSLRDRSASADLPAGPRQPAASSASRKTKTAVATTPFQIDGTAAAPKPALVAMPAPARPSTG